VHDFGHTPFGHSGERALDICMKDCGGFDHNAQSLRIVTQLERRYAEFDGLNLSWETLEGLVKHNGPLADSRGAGIKGAIPQPIADFNALFPLDLETHASLEAQAAALADDIAYDTHDIDDGLRAGILDFDTLRAAPLTGKIIAEIEALYPGLDRARMIAELGRRQITMMVEDVVGETSRRLNALNPTATDDIRDAGHAVVAFSADMAATEQALKAFLYKRLYRHPDVVATMDTAATLVMELFSRYSTEPSAMPEEWRAGIDERSSIQKKRHIADFIAGMTDQFAIREHERLFDRKSELR
jgi:dGTPase